MNTEAMRVSFEAACAAAKHRNSQQRRAAMSTIVLHPVTSTQIKAIGYSPELKTLAVTFKSGAGAVYHYPNISQAQYDAFRRAKSLGSHFGKHIKSLPFTKV